MPASLQGPKTGWWMGPAFRILQVQGRQGKTVGKGFSWVQNPFIQWNHRQIFGNQYVGLGHIYSMGIYMPGLVTGIHAVLDGINHYTGEGAREFAREEGQKAAKKEREEVEKAELAKFGDRPNFWQRQYAKETAEEASSEKYFETLNTTYKTYGGTKQLFSPIATNYLSFLGFLAMPHYGRVDGKTRMRFAEELTSGRLKELNKAERKDLFKMVNEILKHSASAEESAAIAGERREADAEAKKIVEEISRGEDVVIDHIGEIRQRAQEFAEEGTRLGRFTSLALNNSARELFGRLEARAEAEKIARREIEDLEGDGLDALDDFEADTRRDLDSEGDTHSLGTLPISLAVAAEAGRAVRRRGRTLDLRSTHGSEMDSLVRRELNAIADTLTRRGAEHEGREIREQVQIREGDQVGNRDALDSLEAQALEVVAEAAKDGTESGKIRARELNRHASNLREGITDRAAERVIQSRGGAPETEAAGEALIARASQMPRGNDFEKQTANKVKKAGEQVLRDIASRKKDGIAADYSLDSSSEDSVGSPEARKEVEQTEFSLRRFEEQSGKTEEGRNKRIAQELREIGAKRTQDGSEAGRRAEEVFLRRAEALEKGTGETLLARASQMPTETRVQRMTQEAVRDAGQKMVKDAAKRAAKAKNQEIDSQVEDIVGEATDGVLGRLARADKIAEAAKGLKKGKRDASDNIVIRKLERRVSELRRPTEELSERAQEERAQEDVLELAVMKARFAEKFSIPLTESRRTKAVESIALRSRVQSIEERAEAKQDGEALIDTGRALVAERAKAKKTGQWGKGRSQSQWQKEWGRFEAEYSRRRIETQEDALELP